MALHLEPRSHPTQVSVVTDAHELLTDSIRLDQLFEQGYKFEAAAAQALVVEALSAMYLLLHHQAYDRPILDKNGRAIEPTGQMTFGKVVALLGSSSAYHIDTLEADLKRYKDLRNDLVHEMSGSTVTFDLDAFFRLGVAIIKTMKPYFVMVIGHIENSRGQN